jgi:hypothetical protein
MIIRKFNNNGITLFRSILAELRSGQIDSIDYQILIDPELTDSCFPNIDLESRKFILKIDLITLLYSKIVDINLRNKFFDEGLWTWLSVFYFESICPERSDGTRKVGEDCRYILNSNDYSKYYRHLLACPTWFLHQLGDVSKIYLRGIPSINGDLHETLASRQEIATSKGIIEAATILYWDAQKNQIKKGAANKDGPGVARRFAKSIIPQFQMTYDVNSMSGKEIVKLLPSEFKKWIPESLL